MIRLTAVQPRRRGRGIETAEQAAERGKCDLALAPHPDEPNAAFISADYWMEDDEEHQVLRQCETFGTGSQWLPATSAAASSM